LAFVTIVTCKDLFRKKTKSNKQMRKISKESYQKLQQLKQSNRDYLQIKLGIKPIKVVNKVDVTPEHQSTITPVHHAGEIRRSKQVKEIQLYDGRSFMLESR
jgi:hypothetical protein